MRTRPLIAFTVILTALGPACIGVNPNSSYMRPALTNWEEEPVPRDRARVVFVRSSASAGAFPIFDERGQFLGESTSGTRFLATVRPGQHYFIVWGKGHTESLFADLAAGRTYWVVVSHRPGLWAVTRGSKLVKEIPSYLANTRPLLPDQAAGQAYLDSMKDEEPRAVRDGIATYRAYPDADKADATLYPADDESRW